MNRINVFPVADGDTGNNIILTVSSIIKRLEISRSAGKTLEKIADLSLEGARGNSGLIVSQYLNGMARNSGEKRALSLPDFGTLVKQAVHDAYRAMESPAEGTILTVLRVWADTIHEESRQPISLKSLFSRGFAAAKKALEKTTQQLAVLREHKVVDAGAWGFVSFLEGIEKLAERGPVPHAFRKSFQSLELISSGQEKKATAGLGTSPTATVQRCFSNTGGLGRRIERQAESSRRLPHREQGADEDEDSHPHGQTG
jgi:dihydroxyacetone kinase-like predicted kinase